MRTGINPNKNKILQPSVYYHQVVIPVYIPNFEGYFKDSFEILKLCLNSLLKTAHTKTFITIVNNGSCQEVKRYLDKLLEDGTIHELIHSTNIGKVNAILKGIVGHQFQFVTIADGDVLFLPGWQQETMKIFNTTPKVGVVGLIPQFNMFRINSGTLLTELLFNKKLTFLPVKNRSALVKFYDSIGWKRDYNQNYLECALGVEWNKEATFLVGSGHVVSTYRGAVFSNLVSHIPYKLGGNSLVYLDTLPLDFDLWRTTTYDNFAYHLGNNIEDWMQNVDFDKNTKEIEIKNHRKLEKTSRLKYLFKNKLIYKVLKVNSIYKMFLRYKNLPENMIHKY